VFAPANSASLPGVQPQLSAAVQVLDTDHSDTLANRRDIAACTDASQAKPNRPRAAGGRGRRRKR
jgi:hypothetical protein